MKMISIKDEVSIVLMISWYRRHGTPCRAAQGGTKARRTGRERRELRAGANIYCTFLGKGMDEAS